MHFEPTGLAGCFVVHLDRHTDERGSFTRLFDADEFAAHGLPSVFVQTSLSVTNPAGSVRGMHLQRPPHEEVKLVRCVRGAVFDVVLDLRPDSPTRGQWRSATLREGDDRLVAIAPGCAHGFQTLTDRADLLYQISTPYAPAFADGVRFDDPAFGIAWPRPITTVSSRDRAWPLQPAASLTPS
jgi:dTDP-4-dehydrorhamnose 3,5-epimerase